MRKRFISKQFAEKLVIVESEVIEILESNKEYENGNIKNVLKCESRKIPDGQLCVLWNRTTVEVGDKVQMQGYFKEDIFIVLNLNIVQKATKKEVCNG